MARIHTRYRVDEEGRLEVVDPGFDSLDVLRMIDPGFRVRRARLDRFTTPRCLRTRTMPCGLTTHELANVSEDILWEVHTAVMARLRSTRKTSGGHDHDASVLDLKVEMARRILSACTLCAHRCRVDRTAGELGICRLAMEARIAEYFIHIAEESPINPSLVLNLAGCGLRCRFCQQGALLNPAEVVGEPFVPGLWDQLETHGARSLSFVGGNPSESLYAVLRFLSAAPANWRLPIGWNCHAYETVETVDILNGLVDVYVPDFKYGSETCGRRLSRIPDYPAVATAAVTAMLEQAVPVIVRILVLPGHIECCHRPVLDILATLPRDGLSLSVRGQYCPDWKVTPRDGELARRTTPAEVEMVRAYAREQNLPVLD